ncbi:MAG: SMI1/KNR4 family protein [Gemmataceae bacterium]|nr:SMI1/KNR4 family protein [Gemmataceae bacterium]
MADAPWQALYDRVRIIRRKTHAIVPATDAQLDSLAADLGSPIPESYRAWMKRFGPGELQGWVRLTRIDRLDRRRYYPDTVASRTSVVREITARDKHVWPNHAWLSSVVYFASSGGGDEYAWDPATWRRRTGESRFWFLPRMDEANPVAAGDCFWRFIEWAEADIASWPDREGPPSPELDFVPYDLRKKNKPTQAEIAVLLARDAGTIRRLALALRADPRPAEFGVLADALEEAGCDCADLLASCRPGSHPKDREWALQVLLGK